MHKTLPRNSYTININANWHKPILVCNAMNIEDKYLTSSELAQSAKNISMDARRLHNMKSPAYKEHVLSLVRKSDRVLKLIWQVAEYDRLSLVEEKHRGICQQWMKECEAPEWCAWMNLVRFNKRLDKMIKVTLGSVIENIGICCGEIIDDDVIDIQAGGDLFQRRADLDEEYEIQDVHYFIDLSKQAINNSLNYSAHAASTARGVMVTKQYELVRSKEWRNKMGLSCGKPLAFPMSDDVIKAQVIKIFPTTPDELL